MAQKLTKKSKVAVKPVKSLSSKKGSRTMPKEYFSAVGSRKTAIARVRLWAGKQEIAVNGKPLSAYFKDNAIIRLVQSPLVTAEALNQFTGSIKVAGSGIMGQAEAVVNGIGKALAKADPEKFKKLMRDNGFLTRDPRMKETRKPGQGGRARAKKQSPKR